jgi:hypothetical protein
MNALFHFCVVFLQFVVCGVDVDDKALERCQQLVVVFNIVVVIMIFVIN